MKSPRFSVVIPSRNGLRYLPYAIESILGQSADNFELIVSDNHSRDDTWGYLSTLIDPRLRAVRPPEPLSMARHFEFAINEARGEWITVLGDDDALQPYFFELAEKLVLTSESPVISSRRAYFYWPGCEVFYKNMVVDYGATTGTSVRYSWIQLAKLLLQDGHYFENPQFYTGTVFRRELLDDIRQQQNGILFKSTILDANSVALIFEYSSCHTYSHIPLAWVGSSPKSNGFAQSDSAARESDSQKIVEDFSTLNAKDNIRSNERFPGMAFINHVDLYFLEAFFQVHSGRKSTLGGLLEFRLFVYVIFIKIFRVYKEQHRPELKTAFETIFEANRLNLMVLRLCSGFAFFVALPFVVLNKGLRFLRRRARILFGKSAAPDDWVLNSDSKADFPTILDASRGTMNIYKEKLS